MSLRDALKLKRSGYARFVVHPTWDTGASEQELRPLAAWGGGEFDVKRDPADARLAVVRFDVWRSPSVRPGAPVVVTTHSRGDDGRDLIVSYGTVEGGDPPAEGPQRGSIARADAL